MREQKRRKIRLLRDTRPYAYLAAFCVWPLFLFALCGCGADAGEQITTAEQLNAPDKKIAVMISTPEEKALAENLPQAREVDYTDLLAAYEDVKNGRMDGLLFNRTQMEIAIENGLSGVRLLDGTIGSGDRIGIAISPKTRIPDLKEQVDAFLDEIKADGTMDDIVERWTVKRDYRMPDIPVPKSPDKTLVVGTVGISEPYTFYQGAELAGTDIELSYRFALWLNADLSFKVYDYTGIISAAQSGDVDMIAANLYITPEKEEELEFSQDLYTQPVTMMVRDASHESLGRSAWISVKNSFEKTFVREGRWALFVQGILTTIAITVFSILFGTLLGFFTYMACRSGNRAANLITTVCIRLVEGIPIVVLLMIIYYVIFGKIAISGTVVAIITFSLLFGATMYGMLRSSVGSIDKGQTEAAYALGYTPKRTFYRIILPQALRLFLPTYKSEVLSLIKATAIVGYIAAFDLTKAGDIVRSRTYEAFFPLIAVAVIYFVIGWLLTLLINAVIRKIESRHKNPKEILKGVAHD